MDKFDDIKIKPAKLEDAQTLFRIHLDSVTKLCAGSYTDYQISGWFAGRTPTIYIEAIKFKMIWIARIGGCSVGFTEFSPGEVSSLFVRSDAVKRGVGSKLFEFALQGAKRAARIAIKVEATKNAVSFYERYGFKPVANGILKRASGFDIETVIMKLPFQAEINSQ